MEILVLVVLVVLVRKPDPDSVSQVETVSSVEGLWINNILPAVDHRVVSVFCWRLFLLKIKQQNSFQLFKPLKQSHTWILSKQNEHIWMMKKQLLQLRSEEDSSGPGVCREESDQWGRLEHLVFLSVELYCPLVSRWRQSWFWFSVIMYLSVIFFICYFRHISTCLAHLRDKDIFINHIFYI